MEWETLERFHYSGYISWLLYTHDGNAASCEAKSSLPLAKLPTRGSAQAAGYDLYACEDATIPRGGRTVVQTGIHIALPEGHYGRVAPRSGLAVKHGIDVGAGVVDSDYRGLLGIVLFNFGTEDFQCMYG